jgi:hypothetical protein
MRCKSCDTILNDYDLKRKCRETGEFLDLCGTCYSHSEEARFMAEEANQGFLATQEVHVPEKATGDAQ